jgi:hypothetical protein
VNNTEDRIMRFQEAGYEVVQDENVQVGDKRASTASAIGSAKEIPVGGGIRGVVMRIKREWHEEDQAEKQKRVDDVEASIKRKALDGTYGSLEVSRG